VGQPITAPEVRRLFDAAANDYGRGRVDPELPESPEAFYKALQRGAVFWTILDPDKNYP